MGGHTLGKTWTWDKHQISTKNRFQKQKRLMPKFVLLFLGKTFFAMIQTFAEVSKWTKWWIVLSWVQVHNGSLNERYTSIVQAQNTHRMGKDHWYPVQLDYIRPNKKICYLYVPTETAESKSVKLETSCTEILPLWWMFSGSRYDPRKTRCYVRNPT